MARVEAQARGQRPDRSVLLSASAGSGKTRSLVRRIVHLLSAGAAPESIAAITFTEKAAAQMKDRLYGELAGAAWDGVSADRLLELLPEDMPFPLRKTPEEIFSGLAVRPDSLKISTIHAFCLGLLRQFPIEAGLPADFRVMDDTEIPIRRDMAADGCLDAVEAGGLAEEFRALADAGLSVRAVKELLMLALDKRTHISMLETDLGGFDGLVAHLDKRLNPASREKAAREMLAAGEIAGTAGDLLRLLKEYRLGDEDYLSAIGSLAGLDGLEKLPDAFGCVKEYFYTKDKEFSYRKKTPLPLSGTTEALKAAHAGLTSKALKEKAREVVALHDGLFGSLREKLDGLAVLYDEASAARALTAFLGLYKKAEELYRQRNAREGLVDYDDLETHAYRLLSGPDAQTILYRLEAKVLHYLVDEFQDTGDLQWGIISRLCPEVFAGQGAEGLAAPTLFAVGDKKQSIYRFRRANYRLMDILRRRMEECIEPSKRDFPELDMNFRSAPEVLKVVDETFEKLIEGYRTAEPVRKEARGSVKLRVVPKLEEADTLAEEVLAAVGLPIWDEGAGEFRPAHFGDMAVLLRARIGLGAYEDALRGRGIPFKVAGGVGFFFQDEVRALLGILDYLEDPSDLLSLAAALKSPLFRLSDGDLEPLYQNPEPLDALLDVDPGAHRLISSWREKAGVMPLGRLVEDIVRDSAALFAFGVSGGPAAALNVEKLTGIARDFDRRGGVGLHEFVEWVKAYREKADLPTADVDLPGFERFVGIMTVHAAKGLEFPVVFLPGAARRTNKTVDGLLMGEGEDRPVMALRMRALRGEDPLYRALREDEALERTEEAKRLLYVAMTRAKDHLILIAGAEGGDGSWKADPDSWLSLLHKARPQSLFGKGPEPGEVPSVYGYPDAPPPVMDGARDEAGPMPDSLDLTGLSRADFRPLPDEGGVSFTSPSRMAKGLPEEPDGLAPYSARLRGALIHAALEMLGKDGEFDLRAAAGRTAGFASLGREAGDALLADAGAALSRLLGDEEVSRLLSSGEKRFFELPLLLKRENEVVMGAADLVIIEGKKAKVVDYKTGLAGVPEEAVREAYAQQLSAYCEAVGEAFGLREVEACLVLVDRGKVVPCRP